MNRILPIVTVVIAVCAILALTYKYIYPFGSRDCTLPCMHSALRAYAADHYGRFPTSDHDAYTALGQLFAQYTPSGAELAGISGNEDTTKQALQHGRTLDKTLTSWVYVEGLRESDNPKTRSEEHTSEL